MIEKGARSKRYQIVTRRVQTIFDQMRLKKSSSIRRSSKTQKTPLSKFIERNSGSLKKKYSMGPSGIFRDSIGRKVTRFVFFSVIAG